MNRAEAYKILGIDPSSDVRPVDGAYWDLARTYSAQLNHDHHAAERLNELNEAYSVLVRAREAKTIQTTKAPPQPKMRLAKAPPQQGPDGAQVLEAISRWVHRQAGFTAARWAGHRLDIGILTVCLLVLAGLALLGGPSLIATLMVVAAALLTIWSPWRKVS